MSEIDLILQKSQNGFLQYRKLSGTDRASLLESIAGEIEGIGPALITQAMTETNLPEARLTGERGRTCTQLRQFATLIREGSWVEARVDTAIPDRAPLPKPDIRKMLVPLGPVVVFGASNFPFAYSTAGVDTCSALAAGCAVVLKAHPAHPRTSDMVAAAISKALQKAELSQDIFIHVHGASFETGKSLVQHPLTKAVGFTGSFAGGKALYDYAIARKEPIPVFSEMGSINPVYILPGALKTRGEKVAEQYAASITQGVGQFCTNPGLLLGVHSAELRLFSQQLGERLKTIAPGTMLHQGIASNFKTNRTKALAQHGVTLVAESVDQPAENQAQSTLATVSGREFLNNPELVEEVFGPYSLLVKAESMDELRAAAEAMPGQLTSTIIAEPEELIEQKDFIQLVMDKAGRVIINGIPTGVEVCPAMHHGGPFPSTTDSRFTSVGIDAIKRFVRPVSFQNFPDQLLPVELQEKNPMGIWRMYNSQMGKQ